jgi:hypothetical protein
MNATEALRFPIDRIRPGGRIDWSFPPTEIAPYIFGDAVNRNNSAAFLVASFARSRGLVDRQAYYFKYTETHFDRRLTGKLTDLVDCGGMNRLSLAERRMVVDEYGRRASHKPVDALEQEKNTSFENIFTLNVSKALAIMKNAGGVMTFGDEMWEVQKFDRSALALPPQQFLQWLAREEGNLRIFIDYI